MNLSKIDLNLFLVFDAIVQTGSLTSAARDLHLSQPAVSHALSRLREALGDPLFVRQGRRMLPTPYARGLTGSVRQALTTLQSGIQAPQVGFDAASSDRAFTIGMRDILESLTLPGLMAHVRQHAPGISVHSIQVERNDIADALRQGRVDAAVDIVLPVPNEVSHTRLVLDKLVVVARRGHPAVRHAGAAGRKEDGTPPSNARPLGAEKTGGTLRLDDYLAASHVLVSARRQGLGIEDHELSRLGLRRQIGLRCRHYFAGCRVVSQTDMLLTMPEQYARVANQHFDNALHAFPLPSAQLDAHLYWHASLDDDPTNLWFRQRVIEAVKLELAAASRQQQEPTTGGAGRA